jgi:hypothetical protein
MSTLNGDIPAERLMEYRAAHSHLPGHPELDFTPGVKFSSGRLGHMWPYVNGVAIANPAKTLYCLGSDGSQQEGNDAEAARLAVAQGLNVKLIIDDNDVTIAGHPSKYLKGCTTAKTLAGQGITVLEGDGEDFDDLYNRICIAINTDGKVAVTNHRPMCPGIVGLEGSTHGHDVISVKVAVEYLETRGQQTAADHLKTIVAPKNDAVFLGSSDRWDANRNVLGDAAVEIMGRLSEAERIEKFASWTVIWKVPAVCSKFTQLSRKHLFHPALWSAATFLLRPVLVWKHANRVFLVPSVHSWKCCFLKSPLRV